jgi:type I restriction enzyme S subunit
MKRYLIRKDLPKGWRWVKLGKVCRQDRRIIESNSAEAATLTYYSLEHIESGTGRILKEPIGQVEEEGKSTTFYFDERHVLYGKLRPYLNKVALPDRSGRCTTEMIPLIPIEDVDRAFLAWMLRHEETVDFAMQGKTGSRMPRADVDNLMTLEIPLPPLDEQKRIASILNEQMAAVERARKAAEARLEATRALPTAYLREAFKNIETKKWQKVNLGDVGMFDSGGTPPKSEPNFWGGSIPFVTGADITEIYITSKNARAFLTDEGLNSGKTAICKPGTVLFVTRTRVGRAGIAREIMGASQDLSPFTCGSEVIPEFVCKWLLNISGYLIDSCRGATIQGLTRDFIEKLYIPLPPLSEQKHIVSKLHEQMASVEKARKAAIEQLNNIEAMPAAILRKAFNGEL